VRSTPTTKTRPRAAKNKAQLRADAYVLLEITPEDVTACPRIEHLFKGIGGQSKVLEYLAGSEEPEARAVLAMRDRLSYAQAGAVPFEAYCVAAKISTKKMFGVISQEVMTQSSAATMLISKAAHPKVVEATIARAMGPLGTADARMLHQAEGFVPVPKNSITHIHGNVDARTQTANVAVLPPVEDNVRRLSDRFNSAMVAPPAQIAAAFEDEEDDEE
jgi:hypothetical protein